jgi:hypothetical protein
MSVRSVRQPFAVTRVDSCIAANHPVISVATCRGRLNSKDSHERFEKHGNWRVMDVYGSYPTIRQESSFDFGVGLPGVLRADGGRPTLFRTQPDARTARCRANSLRNDEIRHGCGFERKCGWPNRLNVAWSLVV